MAKKKGTMLTRLQSVTRKTRTVLSRELLNIGLYVGQDKIILALAQEDGQSPSALAQALGVQPPTITKMIHRLTAQGFLEKRLSTLDARRTHVFLTPAGNEAIKAIQNALRNTEDQALAGLDKKDLKTLKRLLDQIGDNLNNHSMSVDMDETIAADEA